MWPKLLNSESKLLILSPAFPRFNKLPLDDELLPLDDELLLLLDEELLPLDDKLLPPADELLSPEDEWNTEDPDWKPVELVKESAQLRAYLEQILYASSGVFAIWKSWRSP